jgi:LPS export ABC transporter protein LptC
MRSVRPWTRFILAIVAFLGGTAVWSQKTEPTARPPGIEVHDKFTVNSTRKDGRVEWKLEGSTANFLTPTLIEIKDVHAIYFAEDGTNTVATTEKALLDKEKKRVTTDAFVTIVTENSVTTGTGLDWDQETKKGSLKRDVKVVYTTPEGKGILQ